VHAKLLGNDAVGIAQDLERGRVLEEPFPHRSVVVVDADRHYADASPHGELLVERQ